VISDSLNIKEFEKKVKEIFCFCFYIKKNIFLRPQNKDQRKEKWQRKIRKRDNKLSWNAPSKKQVACPECQDIFLLKIEKIRPRDWN